MDVAEFETVLAAVAPLIQKANTTYRESISAEERLMVTLRYLATGSRPTPNINVVYLSISLLVLYGIPYFLLAIL